MLASKRYGMAVDTRRCVGCNACVIACKTENALPEGGFRDWIVQEVWGTFPNLSMQIRSERCNQCSDAPCVGSCPYGARWVHPGGFVDKCTFCLHRVQRGVTTACAEVCPTRSLTFGD